MQCRGIEPPQIDGWMSGWDHAAVSATVARTLMEEAPATFSLLSAGNSPMFHIRDAEQATRTARNIGRQLGLGQSVPVIATPHHDNHAWFSFAISPFARSERPVMVATLDMVGDHGAVSLYVCERGVMRKLYSNDSFFDSLGFYYAVISSTHGGWTMLSSEGRYMGAAALGNCDRKTNPYYQSLRHILIMQPDGQVLLNRALANWPRNFSKPYTKDLVRILGEPIALKDMWNPDAVLRVEDIKHKEDTQERLGKAAATQMVVEDALLHVIDHLIRTTSSD